MAREATDFRRTQTSPNASPLAPMNPYSERQGTVYEVKTAPNSAGGRGPLRFEEGLATDTDLPAEMTKGCLLYTSRCV